MRSVFTPRRSLPLLLLLLLGAGCNRDAPQLASVRGRVFYHDTPLSSGTIVFTPDPGRGGRGPLARADIQPDGTFTLSTESEAGAVTGWHRITVLAVSPATADASGQARLILPRKYSDPELSGLVREVRAGEENSFELHLD